MSDAYIGGPTHYVGEIVVGQPSDTANPDVFLEGLQLIELGIKPLTAAGLGGVLVE